MRGNSFDLFRSKGLHEVDPTISDLLQRELERQRDSIELIASESFTWPAVLEAESSVAGNKYASGFPGRRFYPGCELVDAIELLAIERARTLFGAEHANVQPYSGSLANEAVFMACLEPGDTILSLPFHQGGHPTHGYDANLSGRLYNTVSYDLDRETSLIDYEQVRSLALEHRPRLIICGGSAYPRTVQVERFREIADEVGALLLCDMAHFAGLVAPDCTPIPFLSATSSPRPRTRPSPGRAAASFSARPNTPGRSTTRSIPSFRAVRWCSRLQPRRPASRSRVARPSHRFSAGSERTPIALRPSS